MSLKLRKALAGMLADHEKQVRAGFVDKHKYDYAYEALLDGVCDGCAIEPPWEHRCSGIDCQCHLCAEQAP